MFNLLSFPMYRSMSFELKCAVNSVALKLMLALLISYLLSAVLACQHGGVNRMGHVTAGALLNRIKYLNRRGGTNTDQPSYLCNDYLQQRRSQYYWLLLFLIAQFLKMKN